MRGLSVAVASATNPLQYLHYCLSRPFFVCCCLADSGQAGGLALVDVLLNEPEGPSGKLTTTWMKTEQLGDYMSYNMSGSLGPTGKTYKYLTAEPYYRFGAGKSYGSFTYLPPANKSL